MKYKDELEDFLFFSPRPTSEGVINPHDIGLSYCSSVPSAIDFSLQMGCKKIFLFGVDHTIVEGKHHFWQFMEKNKRPKATPPAQGSWNQQKTVFKTNIIAYEALKLFAESKGVDIYNISNITKVKIFKNLKLGEINGNNIYCL